jgi:hypothetical protein
MFKALLAIGLVAVLVVTGAKVLRRHGVSHSNLGPTMVTVSVPNPFPTSGSPQRGGNIYVP